MAFHSPPPSGVASDGPKGGGLWATKGFVIWSYFLSFLGLQYCSTFPHFKSIQEDVIPHISNTISTVSIVSAICSAKTMITVLPELPLFKWQNFRCEHLGQATMTTTHGIRLVFLISETSILIMTRTGWLGSTPPSRTLTWPVVSRATESSRWCSSQKFSWSRLRPFHSTHFWLWFRVPLLDEESQSCFWTEPSPASTSLL